MTGTWTYKLGNVRRTLYHLPELLVSDPGQPVLFVEGDKDCHSAEALGFTATTSPGGANQWPGLVKNHRIHEPLKDRSVWSIPDNDPPGKDFANAVAATLAALAKEVKVLILPGLEEKQDLSDFVTLHGPQEAKRLLLELAKAAPVYRTEGGGTATQGNIRRKGQRIPIQEITTTCERERGRVFFGSAQDRLGFGASGRTCRELEIKFLCLQ